MRSCAHACSRRRAVARAGGAAGGRGGGPRPPRAPPRPPPPPAPPPPPGGGGHRLRAWPAVHPTNRPRRPPTTLLQKRVRVLCTSEAEPGGQWKEGTVVGYNHGWVPL